jgi:hypothetical protein
MTKPAAAMRDIADVVARFRSAAKSGVLAIFQQSFVE